MGGPQSHYGISQKPASVLKICDMVQLNARHAPYPHGVVAHLSTLRTSRRLFICRRGRNAEAPAGASSLLSGDCPSITRIAFPAFLDRRPAEECARTAINLHKLFHGS
jgi:hypothetical protein